MRRFRQFCGFCGIPQAAILAILSGLDSLADQGMMPLREKLALNVVPPTMSAPIRSQSGSRFALRIQLCRSGENGVPGATMGLGAESQRKLPA